MTSHFAWRNTPATITKDRHYTMRTDMTYPGGVVHCWGWNTTFTVGISLSSTDITVHVDNDKPT